MLSLIDANPRQLRAIADFFEQEDFAIDGLLDEKLLPVMEYGGQDDPVDRLIGFESVADSDVIYDGDTPVGFVPVKE